jgi:lysozyme family protein
MVAANFPGEVVTELGYEGGFVDDPQDPGGATMEGITLNTFSHFEGSTQTVAQLRAIAPETVSAIYRALYWNAVHGDALPSGVDLIVFDTAINSGPHRAAEFLQRALGMPDDHVDGSIGPQTLEAVAKVTALVIIDRFTVEHDVFYHELPGFGHFGAGWENRLHSVEAKAVQLAKAA